MKYLHHVKLFQNKKTSLLLALVNMFFWGSLFPMIKIGYRAFAIDPFYVASVLLFAGVRFVICGILLTAIFGQKNGRLIVPTRSVLSIVFIVALTAYVLHYTCTYIGLSHLESSKTSILKQVGTLFIVCFAFLFRKEDKFTPAKLIGGLLGFASIIIVNIKGMNLILTMYDFLIISASFCSVISTIVSKNAYDTYSPMVITAWAQLLGGVVLLGLGLLLGGKFSRFDGQSIAVLGYICFASCIGYYLWNMLLKYNDMSRLNIIKFSETMFAAVCSWVLLGENIFRVEYFSAFLLVCIGIMIGNGTLKLPERKEQG